MAEDEGGNCESSLPGDVERRTSSKRALCLAKVACSEAPCPQLELSAFSRLKARHGRFAGVLQKPDRHAAPELRRALGVSEPFKQEPTNVRGGRAFLCISESNDLGAQRLSFRLESKEATNLGRFAS